jgi:hypothetical protein
VDSNIKFTGQHEEGNLHDDFWLTQLQGEKPVRHYVAEVI